jgi:Arc/MetJ-type ribon-helix-helix transcriptional regulator
MTSDQNPEGLVPADLLPEVEAVADEEHRSAGDVVREAIGRYLRQKQESEAALAEFRASLDEAEAALARGEGIEGTPDTMRQLIREIHRRGGPSRATKSAKG